MFTKVSSPVCRNCQEEEDADFEKIHEVISKDETLNVKQVAEASGVDVAVVRRMVEEGLVAQVTLGDTSVVCGQCGAPAISMSKKLCQACLDKLNVQVSKAQAQIKLTKKQDVQIGEYNNAREAFQAKRK
tara:strand:+ start:391 stop:780 length:390 start_codon:yes stop_codon:yes gene_type:complete